MSEKVFFYGRKFCVLPKSSIRFYCNDCHDCTITRKASIDYSLGSLREQVRGRITDLKIDSVECRAESPT
jgi:hypothetical protein